MRESEKVQEVKNQFATPGASKVHRGTTFLEVRIIYRIV